MQINNNIPLDQSAYLNTNQSLNRIATGVALNNAADNASSLAIAQKLQVESSGLAQSIDNVNSGLASLQIADGGLKEQSSILDQVKEKLLQASTDTTSQDGRKQIVNEIQDLLENFNSIASSTNYNGQTLLQNSETNQAESEILQFQAGTNSEDIIETSPVQSNTLGVGLDGLLAEDADTFSSEDARSYLDEVDSAINTLNDFRSDIGSAQNQLQSSSNNLFTQYTQTSGASSIIQDIDYAQEVSNFSKQNILAQIGAYGAAQSNNINQSIVTRLLS